MSNSLMRCVEQTLALRPEEANDVAPGLEFFDFDLLPFYTVTTSFTNEVQVVEAFGVTIVAILHDPNELGGADYVATWAGPNRLICWVQLC